MRKVSLKASKVINRLTGGLEVGEARTIDNTDGVYMAVHVERLTTQTFSIAHYFEQNGDLVPDPDGVFWRDSEGRWYPVSLQQQGLRYTPCLYLAEDEQPERFSPSAMREIAVFAAGWMENIRLQQGL